MQEGKAKRVMGKRCEAVSWWEVWRVVSVGWCGSDDEDYLLECTGVGRS